jgi:DHA1 family bicyclomycin/chloramphenicol resistance-like MFS transporter
MIGAFLSGRLAGNLTPKRTVSAGFLTMGAAAVFNLGYCAGFPPALPWTVLPVMLYTVGMSLAMPSVTLITLDRFPAQRGMTSSFQGFAHSLFAGITAGVVSPLVSAAALTLAAGMAAMLLLGWWCWRLYLALEHRG